MRGSVNIGNRLNEAIQRNLDLTNLKGPKISFFIAGVLLLQVFFTIKSTTKLLKMLSCYCRNFVIEGLVYNEVSV